MTSAILQARDISLIRGKKRVLSQINIDIVEGEVLALIGPNGAGKSTLVQVLAGLLPAATGELLFASQRVEKLLSYRRQLAVVFQEPLLVDATVWENAALGLVYRGLKSGDRKRLVHSWLERLGISHLKQRKARELSGGEAQRLAIARALILNPRILFLDEPFANLDALTRSQLREDLLDILHENAVTAVLVTHDFQELPLLATRVAAMEAGQIVQLGSVKEILETPVKKSLAQLVGMENLWQLSGLERDSSGWKAVLTGGQRVYCNFRVRPDWVGVRPEKIKPFDSTCQNCFEGKVSSILPFGNHYTLVVDCGIKLRMVVSCEWLQQQGLKFGDMIKVSVAPRDVHPIYS